MPQVEKKFKNTNISRPSHWNGYQVLPNLIEFWQEMPYRVHDRITYTNTDNMWVTKKLYP